MTEGTIERTAERVILRYERVLLHPIEAVWRAITDPDEIHAWWGTRPEIDLRVGGEYVSYHATGDRVVDHIVRLDPPRLLEHTFWQHINPDARVTYRLEPVVEGTRLLLTHTMTTADLRTAADALAWEGDPYDLVSRTSQGWARLLDTLAASLD